jgi:hypothetical protein
MSKLGLSLLITGLFAVAAYAGGGDFNDYPQQQTMAPPSKVVVIDNNDGDGGSWAVPIVVATIGAVGVVGAAWAARQRG